MAESPTGMTRSIWAAGLLGGLLGGVVSFAASRIIVPAPAVTPSTAAAESRPVVESFIGKLQSEKADGLEAEATSGRWLVTEQELASFRGQFNADRTRFVQQYGPRTGEFELVREEVLGPSIVRVVYLERYQRDGILWIFVVYRTIGEWRVVGVSWKEKLAVAVDALN